VQRLVIQRAVAAVAALQAVHGELAEVFVAIAAIGHRILRVAVDGGRIEVDFDIAALGDLQRGIAGLRHLGKQRAHFLGGLEIDLRGVGHAVLVVDARAGADADHDVVGLVIVAVEEMHVVGGDGFEAVLFAPLDHLPGALALLASIVVLDFEVEILGAEDVAELLQALLRLVLAVGEEEFVDLAVDAAAEADEALRMLAQRVLIDTRLVPLAIEVTFGDEFGEIVEAFVAGGQQREVGGAFAARDLVFVHHRAGAR
jgi:hypothetical protein